METERTRENCKSVVQTLLHRQLGFPSWTRNSDNCEVLVARQIFQSRATSEDVGKSVKPGKVGLRQQRQGQGQGVKNDNKENQHKETLWNQMTIADDCEISVADTQLWTRNLIIVTDANGNLSSQAKEEFFSVEPSSHSGFKLVKAFKSTTTAGKVEKALITGGRTFSSCEKSTTLLLTLTSPGILRAYDLVKNQIVDEISLPNRFSYGQIKFPVMDACDGSRKIIITGTPMTEVNTKVLILLEYPPWEKISILHVEIPYQIVVNDGVCFIFHGRRLLLTTWNLLMQKVTPCRTSLRNETGNGVPQIKYEGRLSQLPIIISSTYTDIKSSPLLDACSVPMYFAATKTGLDFLTFHKQPEIVYGFQNPCGEGGEATQVFMFEDGSSKALIVTHISGESELVEFKTHWNDEKNEKEVKVAKLDGFNYWEKSRENQQSTVNLGLGGSRSRPKRNCSINNVAQMPRKNAVLGMAYCSVMDLIAVLTADEEEFQVAIYEPFKLGVVKAFPPVRVWPRIRGTDAVNKRRENICNVEFVFEAEYVFISIHYSKEFYPKRDVFFARLLSEQF